MKISRFFFAISFALLSVNPSQATTVIPPDFDELVAQAEIIFQGVVTESRSQFVGEGAQRHIVTYVTFKVDDVVKGTPGGSYTIRMLGGTVGDETMEVTDTPKFKIGDRDILFVEKNGTQFVPLVGIMHGRFRVKREAATGREVVATSEGAALSSVAKLGTQERQSEAGEKALSVADFKAAVRGRVATHTATGRQVE